MTAPILSAEAVAAAVKAGEPAVFWPADFDPSVALALADSTSPSAWSGVYVAGGMVEMDANRELDARSWWGTPTQMGIVERMVREDPVLQGLRLAVTLPLLSGDWTIEPPPDATPAELEAADFVETALFELMPGGWRGWLEQAVQFQWRGFALFELYWPFDKELGRTLLGMRPLMPWTVERWMPTRDGFSVQQWPRTGDRAEGEAYQAKGATLKADEYLALRWMPEADNPAPMGCLRPCWGDWMARSTYRKLQAQAFQRAAFGIPVVSVDPTVKGFDGSATQVAAVNLRVQELRTGLRANMMLPPGYTLSFADFPFKSEAIEAAIIAKGHAMMDSAHASFMRTGQTSGALSLHESQVLFFSATLQQSANAIAEALSAGPDAPIKKLVARNFPNVTRFPWIHAPEIRIGDPSGLVTSVTQALSMGAVSDGDRGIEDRLREIMALPVRPEVVAGEVAPTALNGAQVLSARDIVAAAAAGQIPASTAKAMLTSLLGVPVDAAEAIMRDVAGNVPSTPAPVAAPASSPDGVQDEVTEDIAEAQTQAHDCSRHVRRFSEDRALAGPKGRALHAAEAVVRLSETRGQLEGGRDAVAAVVTRWRSSIAGDYSAAVAKAGSLAEALMVEVPGQDALAADLASELRGVYSAGAGSASAEWERLTGSPSLAAKADAGKLDVGAGGDLPAPSREPVKPVKLPAAAAEAIDGIVATTVQREVGRVRDAAMAELQAAGIGGAMPAKATGSAVVADVLASLSSAVTAKAVAADVNTAFSAGRADEQATTGADQYLYSAMLESESCSPCLSHDGEVFGPEKLADYSTPASWCDGGASCNCLVMAIPSGD